MNLIGLKPYYQNKLVTLFHSSFEDVLPKLKPESINTIISDPPYATTNLKWDQSINWNFFWNEAGRFLTIKSPIVLFASGKFVNQLINTNPKNYRYELIWEKNNTVGFLDAKHRPLRNHENILIFTSKLFRGCTYNPQMTEGKKHIIGKSKKRCSHYGGQKGGMKVINTNLYYPKSILKFSRDTDNLHPTQKPIKLMKWLVQTYSNRNEIILEPFAGSGSTMLAAQLANRRCIGIERDEKFCEIISKRLESTK